MTEAISIGAAFEAALASPHGISLHIATPEECRMMRHRCYAWRERMRRQGVAKYDRLSLIIRDLYELWIVPRVTPAQSLTPHHMRHLQPSEAPRHIYARGKSRLKGHPLSSIF